METNISLFLLIWLSACATAFTSIIPPLSFTNTRYDHSSTSLFGKRMKFQPPPRQVTETEYIQVQSDGEDAWKTMDVVDILDRGGLGVIPTSTGYGFITPLSSKPGLERLMLLIQQQQQQQQQQQSTSSKQPQIPSTPSSSSAQEAPPVIHLLCASLASIDEHCFVMDKLAFKILKKNLPGSFTFILLAKKSTTLLPKEILYRKHQTVHVRMPKDPVLRYLQDELLNGIPLLFLPIDAIVAGGDDDSCTSGEDNDASTSTIGTDVYEIYTVDPSDFWYDQVDFVVNAGPRPKYDISTIYDSTQRGEAVLVSEGRGELELVL